jgi:glycosyltransferase involved in cell wall biosynthesis
MRIVIVTEQYPPMLGGVATVTQHLSQDLAEAGHYVCVVAPSEGHFNEHTRHGRVQVYRFASFEWPAYDGQRIAFPPVAPLRRLLRAVRPDVVHVHSPIVLGNLAQLWASAMHVPVIATNHYMPENIAPTLSNDPLLGKSFDSLAYTYLVSFCNRCDYVTAPTATALALLRQHGLRVPSQPVSNGIDVSRFSPKGRDEALRRQLGLPADRPLILYIGRLSDEKRVQVLVDALAQLHVPAHLAIGGIGPSAEALKEHAASLGIVDRVTFLGRVPEDDLVPLYRLGDVFVMPSTAELQSVAALEALAVGLPVVAAHAGALPELVRDGHNGLLFTPDDSAALAEQLTRLVSDDTLRHTMSENAIATAAQHDRRRVTQEWLTLYGNVAARARRGRAPRRVFSGRSRSGRLLPVRLTRHFPRDVRSHLIRRRGAHGPHAWQRDQRNGASLPR